MQILFLLFLYVNDIIMKIIQNNYPSDGGFVILRLLFLRCVLALGEHKLQFLLDIPRV